jgi:hypothetical protein
MKLHTDPGSAKCALKTCSAKADQPRYPAQPIPALQPAAQFLRHAAAMQAFSRTRQTAARNALSAAGAQEEVKRMPVPWIRVPRRPSPPGAQVAFTNSLAYLKSPNNTIWFEACGIFNVSQDKL